MPDETVEPALKLALRLHEIGDATPYKLYFAGKGNSGASFGFMQGDLAAGPDFVRTTFRTALTAVGISDAAAASFATRLSPPLIENPLSDSDSTLINTALASPTGQPLVDAMDDALLGSVYSALDDCVSAAQQSNRTIAPKAQIYQALWINMTGKPSTLLKWLSGSAVIMAKAVPPPGEVIDGADMEAYLGATNYYVENPQNLPHMLQCAAAGAAILLPEV